MKNISHISTKLKIGDIRDIAAATGFTSRYVGYVLDPNNKRSNALIIKAAEMIISNREKFADTLTK